MIQLIARLGVAGVAIVAACGVASVATLTCAFILIAILAVFA